MTSNGDEPVKIELPEVENIYEIMKNRRTIRQYLTDPIEEASMEKILEAATLPPTGAGLLPYVIIRINKRAKLMLFLNGIQ